MALVFLDLDNTLIRGDSDYLWGEFLSTKKVFSERNYKATNRKFYEDYLQGVLDHDKYLKFSLSPLAIIPTEDLLSLNHEFVETKIRPLIYFEAQQLIDQHKAKKNRVVIHSATNSFIVSPIAQLLGVQDIISTQLEIIGEHYTGKYIGSPNYSENKVKNTLLWLKKKRLSKKELNGSYAYSDSFSDVPLLESVDNPVAVNADSKLRDFALSKDWKIMDFTQLSFDEKSR